MGRATRTLDLSRTPEPDLPATLARLRADLGDAPVVLRLSDALDSDRAHFALEGAGLEVRRTPARRRANARGYLVRKQLTLPDFVRPDLDLLVCGLNPSIYAAETQIPFGRPGNRFWPAARIAGLVARDRDVFEALARGVGFSDLVKRPTRRASEVEREEFVAGVGRIARLVEIHRPRALCMVGLQGYRLAIEPRATPGWQRHRIGGAPTYLMPSTSGLNAHIDTEGLARHLARAAGPLPEASDAGDA